MLRLIARREENHECHTEEASNETSRHLVAPLTYKTEVVP